MFKFHNKIFIGLLSSVVYVSNHTKFVSLSNQKCKIQPTLFDLYPNECTQVLCYCPFAVDLYRCVESCNTLNKLSNKLCVLKKPRRFKSKPVQHDYINKRIKNIKKVYIMQM